MRSQQVLTSLLLICIGSSIVYAMENANIAVKCNSKDIINISLNTLLASNALHEKYLLKKKLALSPSTPIPTTVSANHMCLFEDAAACISQYDFHDFFWKLSSIGQKCLMSISGKDKLDSPLVTTLIATAYLPSELITNHIIPYLDKKDITTYLRCNAIAKNMKNDNYTFDFISMVDTKKHTWIDHVNGLLTRIPQPLIPDHYTSNNRYLKLNDTKTLYISKINIPQNWFYEIYSEKNGPETSLFIMASKPGQEKKRYNLIVKILCKQSAVLMATMSL